MWDSLLAGTGLQSYSGVRLQRALNSLTWGHWVYFRRLSCIKWEQLGDCSGQSPQAWGSFHLFNTPVCVKAPPHPCAPIDFIKEYKQSRKRV